MDLVDTVDAVDAVDAASRTATDSLRRGPCVVETGRLSGANRPGRWSGAAKKVVRCGAKDNNDNKDGRDENGRKQTESREYRVSEVATLRCNDEIPGLCEGRLSAANRSQRESGARNDEQ